MYTVWLLTVFLFANTPEVLIEVGPENDTMIRHLGDEAGAGEKPPSFKLEFSGGLFQTEFLSTGPGFSGTVGAFWRPDGDWWLGMRLTGAGAPRRHDAGAVYRGGASVEGRRYFMLHQEANRFVMGHVLVGLAAETLKMDDETLAGPALHLGGGVGVALSHRRYLGIQWTLSLPWWFHQDADPPVRALFSTLLLFMTIGF